MSDPDTTKSSPRTRVSLRQLQWPVVIGIVLLHVGCLFAPFFFSWSGLIVAGILVWVTGPLGITICYHRLLTHRSFRTPKWWEYLMTICGCLAWQGGPVQWVGTHRIHHKHSDEDLDPHSPTHGFAWSHVFWCLYRAEIFPWTADSAARDLRRDRGMRFIDRFAVVPQLILIALCFLGGTWAAVKATAARWVLAATALIQAAALLTVLSTYYGAEDAGSAGRVGAWLAWAPLPAAIEIIAIGAVAVGFAVAFVALVRHDERQVSRV